MKYTDHLDARIKSPDEAGAYLTAVMEEGDKDALRVALNDIARANGIEAIAAIREGLGKAHGRVVAWVTPLRCGQQVTFYKPPTPTEFLESGSNADWYCLPLYYAPPADSAQVLVDALEKIARVNAMDYEYQRWAREALAAHKSEVKG